MSNFTTCRSAQPNSTLIMALLLGIIVFQVASGLYLNLQSPYWLDEVFTGALACQKDTSSVFDVSKHDVHPPTFVLLVHGLFSLFDCNLLAVRWMNIAFSFAGAALLALSLNTDTVGRLKLMLIIVAMPTFWYYAIEARSYSLMFFFSSGVIFLSSRKESKYKCYAVYLALIGSTMNYFGVYLVPISFFLGLIADNQFFRNRRFFIVTTCLATIVIGLYLLCIPNALSATNSGFWIPAPTLELLLGVIIFTGGGFGLPLIGTATFLAYKMRRNLSAQEFLTILSYLSVFSFFVLCAFALSYIRPMFVPRYAYFLTPFLIMAIYYLSGSREDYPDKEAVKFANVTIFSVFSVIIIKYLLSGLTGAISPQNIRPLNWQEAMKNADCNEQSTCFFVLDDKVQQAFSGPQYTALANFLSEDKSAYLVLRPGELTAVLAKNEPIKLMYVASSLSVLNFSSIETTYGLKCRSYIVETQGAKFCTRT